MRTITKLLAGAAGLAAFAAAAPAAAQYYPYGYSTYNPYGSVYGGAYNAYGNYGVNANFAAQQCTAAVQNRLNNRTSLGEILGSLIGLPTNNYGRVLSVTRENATRYGGATLVVAGRDLATWSGWRGLDPEINTNPRSVMVQNDGGGVPLPRRISIGLEVGSGLR